MNDSNNNPKDNPLDVQFAPQSDVAAAPEVKETLTPDMTDNSPAEKPSPEKKPTRGEKKIAKMEKKLADEKAEEERRRMAKLYPGSKNYAKKKKKRKKPLIIALVLVLLAAVGVVGFFHVKDYLADDTYEAGEDYEDEYAEDAEDDEDDVIGGETGNLSWTLEDGVLTISGEGEMPDYDGYDVFAPWIGDYKSEITSVIIEDGITSIGYGAFTHCSSLTSVTIPDSVASIEGTAFDCCESLTSITIPASVTSIGNHTFYACSNLAGITIPNSVTSIGGWAFVDCDSLTSVTIPDSVTSIGDSAFSGCDSLTTIEVSSDNKHYTSVDGILFDKKMTTLVQFPCRNSKTSYVIPDSVTTIGYGAFEDCDSLTDIYFGGTRDEWNAMDPDEMDIPQNATVHCSDDVAEDFAWTLENGVLTISGNGSMPDYQFSSNRAPWYEYKSDITAVVIDEGITRIGDWAFDDCDGLTSITIPDSVTAIGASAFYNCDNLTSITIPDSVTTIGASAFCVCDNLTSITIPDSVTSLGACAFRNCFNLASITIPASVTSIGYEPFSGCYNLINISVVDDNKYYCDVDGILFDKNMTTLIAYPAKKTLSFYTIPESVTSICSSAFWSCNNLRCITVPGSVTSIGGYAFGGCYNLTSIEVASDNKNYTSVEGVLFDKGMTTLVAYPAGKSNTDYTIPDSVTTIGDWAFSGCYRRTSITIPDSVTTIGDWAFYNCDSLTSITIPDSVTTIGAWAFYDCDNLTSITIPDSVTTIGNQAFYCCDNLTDIHFGGTREEWNALDPENMSLPEGVTVHCSDGDI